MVLTNLTLIIQARPGLMPSHYYQSRQLIDIITLAELQGRIVTHRQSLAGTTAAGGTSGRNLWQMEP